MTTNQKLLCLPFWVAVLLVLLACFIDLAPGASCGWFVVVALLSCAGFFIPSRFYRVAAPVLLMLALTQAYVGYRWGAVYHHWLSVFHGGTP
jgi:hypothetical protein